MKRFLLLLIYLCFACGNNENPSELGRIIGENDLEPVIFDEENASLVKAIGRMRVGCTVTHIGGGIGITAGHCFRSVHFEGIQRGMPCDKERYSIVWGLVDGNEHPLPVECKEVIAFEYNEARDYALLRIDPVPEESIELNFALPQIGDQVSIFSHPQRRMLEWSNYCSIEKIYDAPKAGLMAYSCDTEIGSSGAPILNDAHEMIGLHMFYDQKFPSKNVV